MPVRINGATSGSTTIAAPDTGSDETIVLSTALASKADYPSGGSNGQALIKSGTTTAWGTVGGLILITTTSFSTASSVSVNNCFSSTYENYRVLIRSRNTATLETRLRFRAGGSDDTANTYVFSQMGASTSSDAVMYSARINGGSYFPIMRDAVADAPNHFSIDFHGPALSTVRHPILIQSFEGPNVIVFSGGGGNFTASAFDGFTLYASTSTITGQLWVYGYRKEV